MKKIFYLLATIALLCGCAKTAVDQAGGIYGIITDKTTNAPLNAAGVELYNWDGHSTDDYYNIPIPGTLITKIATGTDGHFEFNEINGGNYVLHVTMSGYTDVIYSVQVTNGQTAHADMQMEKLPPSLRVVNDNKQDISSLDFGSADADITRSFNIFNDGPESLEWQITVTAAWIVGVSKTSGTLNAGATQSVILTIDRNKLASGGNTTTVQITSNNGSKQITVTATGETRILPTLNTLDVSNIMSTSAVFNGQILTTGTPGYTERGFVYSLSSMPTVETTITKVTAAVTANNTYSSTVGGLSLGQTYFVRAYAVNKAGTAYSSNDVSFKTAMVLPVVTTQDAADINENSATLNGNITSTGDPAYTERGFVYNTSINPTIENCIKKEVVSGSGAIGQFSKTITGLTTGTPYYFCAYATNSAGTVYGQSLSFTPNNPNYVILSTAGIMVQKKDITNGTIDWNSANNLCKNSTVGGYTDWRMPTLNELAAMYSNKESIGGFTVSGSYPYYMSSTISSDGSWGPYYYCLNFWDGRETTTFAVDARARAVRTLP